VNPVNLLIDVRMPSLVQHLVSRLRGTCNRGLRPWSTLCLAQSA
jgi:hypothetical protein